MDEDGFQQVRHRKNTRKNIFDIVIDEMRSSIYALGEEIRAARYKSRQRVAGQSYEGQEEWRAECQPANPADGEGSGVKGDRELGSAKEAPNNKEALEIPCNHQKKLWKVKNPKKWRWMETSNKVVMKQ